MRYFIIVLNLFFALPSNGQEIHTIILSSLIADEPPTKQGQSEYSIAFQRDNKVMKSPQQSTTIDYERIATVGNWIKTNKKSFKLSELGLTYDELIADTSTNSIKHFFDIPKQLIVNIDSFHFCQEHKMTKTLSTGGYELVVKLINESGIVKTFEFHSNDMGEGKFHLQSYLLCYEIFKDVIISEKFTHNFFSKNNLINILLGYQNTVECEGFYYKEFVSKNPNRTSKENRLMTGWNFVEYLNNKKTGTDKLLK